VLEIDGSLAVCRVDGLRGTMSGSTGGAGEVGGDDVGGVSVEGCAGSVVSHGGSRIGV